MHTCEFIYFGFVAILEAFSFFILLIISEHCSTGREVSFLQE